MIEFYLDTKSGVSPYLQLVHQVRRALKLGTLREGDQLPTVREVVGSIAINPNTVSKAYRELEHEGLIAARAGVGTFVTARRQRPGPRTARAAAPRPRAVAPPRPRRRARRRVHRGAVPHLVSVRHPRSVMSEAALETNGLGKRYRSHWALEDCTLRFPRGHVVGLVGPNGAGKSTLLNLAAGLLEPTAGSIEVLGQPTSDDPALLARIGFVPQDASLYGGLSVEDHLRLGAHLNPVFDDALARARIDELGLRPRQRAGRLSGGQRAQLSLTLALAKRPELLLMDEPVASLDPLARREFLSVLMSTVAGHDVSVVLSSHLVSDIERICDYLVVLVDSRVLVAGELEELLASHHRLIGTGRRGTPSRRTRPSCRRRRSGGIRSSSSEARARCSSPAGRSSR